MSNQCVWINIKRPHNRPLTVGSMYRPPSANQAYYESMIDILDNITNDDHEIVLMGDLNFDYSFKETTTTKHIKYIEQLTYSEYNSYTTRHVVDNTFYVPMPMIELL